MSRFGVSVKLAGLLFVLSVTSGWAATTSGIVSSDETWSGTVTLTGDVICTSGTITVQPGTVVKFAPSNGNVVYGGGATIWITLLHNGGMHAVGTAQNRITFTTATLTPTPGSWGRIEIMALKNDAATTFQYCDFLYDDVGLEWRNPSAADHEITNTIVDNCTFGNFSLSGMYGTDGCNLTITNCVFHDLRSAGIFMHGAGTVAVNYCTIYNVSVGIICAGLDGFNQTMSIDHLTLYNVDMMLATTSQWWTGFGIFCCNTPALTLSLTNSIVDMVSLYALAKGGWTVTENHNCFNTASMLGAIQPVTTALGTGSIEQDPMFLDAANGNFTLDVSSPCLVTGTDGTNMGADQTGAGIFDRRSAGASLLTITMCPQPMIAQTVITLPDAIHPDAVRMGVYTLSGRQVKDLSGSFKGHQTVWNGRDQAGRTVDPGIYIVKVNSGKEFSQHRIVVAR